MDPINALRLGQILQQEIVEQCQRDHEGFEVEGVAALLRKRLRTFASAFAARSERSGSQNSRVECGETLATSH